MTSRTARDDGTGDRDVADDSAGLSAAPDGDRRTNGTFAKGRSGNRRGRPKLSRNLVTLFNEKRDERVAIKIDGKTVRKTRLEVMLINLWNRAMTLDPKALAAALTIMRATGQIAAPAMADGELSEDSAAVLDAYVARMNTEERGGE